MHPSIHPSIAPARRPPATVFLPGLPGLEQSCTPSPVPLHPSSSALPLLSAAVPDLVCPRSRARRAALPPSIPLPFHPPPSAAYSPYIITLASIIRPLLSSLPIVSLRICLRAASCLHISNRSCPHSPPPPPTFAKPAFFTKPPTEHAACRISTFLLGVPARTTSLTPVRLGSVVIVSIDHADIRKTACKVRKYRRSQPHCTSVLASIRPLRAIHP